MQQSIRSVTFADICWLRLDFEQFTMLGTTDTIETTGGVCQDSFSVTVNAKMSLSKRFLLVFSHQYRQVLAKPFQQSVVKTLASTCTLTLEQLLQTLQR